MSLTLSEAFTPATQPVWILTLLDGAVRLGLPTTSWRDGDAERVILTIMSYVGQNWDATASLMSQGGFVDYAATGTVTLQNPDGTSTVVPVSPDPSDPAVNPNGNTTWLDVLGVSNYDLQRIRYTYAGGALAILNTSVSTYGPFAAGGYHVSDPNNKATYTTTVDIASIPPSSLAGTAITGAVSDSGLIKITTSTNHGLVDGDPVFIVGVVGTTEANGAWYVDVLTVTTFDLVGSEFTNAWVSGGLVYEPTVTTVQADIGGSSSNSVDALGADNVNTVTTAVTSLLGVSVSNLVAYVGTDTENNPAYAKRCKLKLQAITTNGAKGAYEFYALSSVQYAPLLNPAKTVAVAINRVLAVQDKLTGHMYVFVANASGAPSTDDLDATDLVLQGYARPLAITLFTLKATEVTVAIIADVYLPAAYNTAAIKALFVAAVQAYFKTFPIGGLSDPGGDYTNVLPIEDVRGLFYETARANSIPLDNLVVTLNGGLVNISLPVSTSVASIAKLSPATPTITLNPT